MKSFIRNNALQQQLHNIVNKSESLTTQTKTINSTTHQQLLENASKKARRSILKRKPCPQQEKHIKKEELSLAEKEFQKQIQDVPIFYCVTCEQIFFKNMLY